MNEHFISEPLQPVAATFDTRRMAMGEPGLPAEFTWRGEPIRIVRVLRTWKETGDCRHGSGEQYVRKHWYEVEDQGGRRLKLYFVRSSHGRLPASRWTLYSLADPEPSTN